MELRQEHGEVDPEINERLTSEELSDTLNRAIVLHGQAECDQLEHIASMDDAIKIARELNISDEYVRAAAEHVIRNRELVAIKREVQKKRQTLVPWIVGFLLAVEAWPVGIAVWLSYLGFSLHHMPIAAVGITFGVVMSAVNWGCYRLSRHFVTRPVSDEEAERAKKRFWSVVLGHGAE